MRSKITRRHMLKTAGASLAVMVVPDAQALQNTPSATIQASAADILQDQTRTARMAWWHAAKFGMFVHFGVYSAIGRAEWIMLKDAIPIREYEAKAKAFNPVVNSPRAWAKLAKRAGMKYMVMTTKHHEGFCNFDSKLTDYCATKQGPRRDLVREYVDAARAEGLRVGFYYSLRDWHHPDGARCATDEAARRRFVDYTHGLIRELMTNYGKIDILWYDVAAPLDAVGWESEKMNEMVFKLQPDIIVNNRNKLPGDFTTPEQKITAEKGGGAWESCMTVNDHFGYTRGDENWKSSSSILRNLMECVKGGGNYLLNIGPKGDGSIPAESERVLTEVGEWLSRNGETIYKAEPHHMDANEPVYATFTRLGNTLYMHIYIWENDYIAICGLENTVKSVRILKSGEPVKFTQDGFQTKFIGLPEKAPDYPITTLVIECDSEPKQNQQYVIRKKPRDGV